MNTTGLIFPTNRVADVERCFLDVLKGLYPEEEIRSFFLMLCDAFLGWDKVAYLLHRSETINQSDLLRFHWALEDLKRHRPIQHIVGYTDFCDCHIGVNENVLIPRPETEEMVGYLAVRCVPAQGNYMEVSEQRAAFRVLDLCTGSGCIAIALKKKMPWCSVTAVDISADALDMAKKNAVDNGADVEFIQGDVLSGGWQSAVGGLWNLIVSNPPYITESEKASMQANVLDYEPSQALFVPDDDPLLFYMSIAAFARQRLSESGLLAMEINERFGQETLQMLRDYGFSAELHKDFRGKDRFVTASLLSR
ncbi:MAG: peptide chain release factor N(5)-glutamine methyltransferase [Bacteroidales bacterium]|nr:peptide chain release factor N(5)-glutamine methyltransferase [Bacteroidales bacterium]